MALSIGPVFTFDVDDGCFMAVRRYGLLDTDPHLGELVARPGAGARYTGAR